MPSFHYALNEIRVPIRAMLEKPLQLSCILYCVHYDGSNSSITNYTNYRYILFLTIFANDSTIIVTRNTNDITVCVPDQHLASTSFLFFEP